MYTEVHGSPRKGKPSAKQPTTRLLATQGETGNQENNKKGLLWV